MILQRIESPRYPHYSYLLGDGGTALVVDPRRDVDVYVQLAASRQLAITDILETHRHEDFVSGSRELAAITGARIWRAKPDSMDGYGTAIEDGHEWPFGKRTVRAIQTPGHTPGSTSFLVTEQGGEPWVLLSGDTLFAGDVGRTDLFGPELAPDMARRLYSSLTCRLVHLNDGVNLLPAHGAGSVCGAAIADRPLTTLGMERRLNPKLAMNEADFLDAARPGPVPPYFERMHELNTVGAEPLCGLREPAALSPQTFEEMMVQAQVVDARPSAAFATSHVPMSLSVYPEGLFTFAGWFLRYDHPLLLVCDPWLLDQTVTTLRRLGFDAVLGYLSGGMMAWHTHGLAARHTPTVAVGEACNLLDSTPSAWLLDVRGEDELVAHGYLVGGHNIPLQQLASRLGEVPLDRPIYIFCGSGVRSTIAASVLAQKGDYKTTVVLGGFTGWRSASCPYRPPETQSSDRGKQSGVAIDPGLLGSHEPARGRM